MTRPVIHHDAGPFGGMKLSGGARELGQKELDEVCETKYEHWEIAGAPKPWWYPYGRESQSLSAMRKRRFAQCQHSADASVPRESLGKRSKM